MITLVTDNERQLAQQVEFWKHKADTFEAELATVRSQPPAWQANELRELFGCDHRAYYLGAGAHTR